MISGSFGSELAGRVFIVLDEGESFFGRSVRAPGDPRHIGALRTLTDRDIRILRIWVIE